PSNLDRTPERVESESRIGAHRASSVDLPVAPPAASPPRTGEDADPDEEKPGRVRQKAPPDARPDPRPDPYEREGTPVRTYHPKSGDITRDWHVLDPEGNVLRP